MQIKIATLKLCQGLPSKKNLVKETIINENIDILSMQEAQINFNFDHNLLHFPGYFKSVENLTNSVIDITLFFHNFSLV